MKPLEEKIYARKELGINYLGRTDSRLDLRQRGLTFFIPIQEEETEKKNEKKESRSRTKKKDQKNQTKQDLPNKKLQQDLADVTY